jgi:tRNA A37 threonylcarbamoyltransferase TsaD
MDTGIQGTMLAIIVIRMQMETQDQRLDPMTNLRFEQAFTSDEEMALLMSGLSTLTQHLLVRLEQATGATTSEILDDVARQVQLREVGLLKSA